MNLRDNQVLQHKENLEWNWNLIGTILRFDRILLDNDLIVSFYYSLQFIIIICLGINSM